jgi:reactive intermediate/imine deaminase
MANSRKQAQNPASVAAPLKGYYSNAVKVAAGPLLFISGQVSVAADGTIVGAGDLRAQAEQVLANIGAILAANDAGFDDVVKVLVYVTDIRAFDEITDIRLKCFPKDGPASAIIEVTNLAHPDFMIEIEAVAVVD